MGNCQSLVHRSPAPKWKAELSVFLAALVLSSSNALGQGPGVAECLASGSTIVTIGLTEQYLSQSAEAGIPAESPDTTTGGPGVCSSVAAGNEYQVLEWLETGKIEAAIVSPFVAEILQKRGDKPLGEFFDLSANTPIAGVQPERYRVGFEVHDSAGPRPDPETVYMQMLEGMLVASDQDPDHDPRIVIDSYLSASLPLLLDYTEAALQQAEIAGKEQKQLFWKWFFDQIMLCDPETCAAPEGATTTVRVIKLPESGAVEERTVLLNSGQALQDLFVHDESLHGYFPLRDVATSGLGWHRGGSIFRWLENDDFEEEDSPGALIEDIYAAHEAAFRTHRHFPFTVDELWTILGARQQGADHFALILTGGGVKAAYQTKLVDYLYGCGYLTNGADSMRGTCGGVPGTITVDQIIGTSGGAMLGAFVAWMADEQNPDLSDTLWRLNNGDYVEFFNIFPWIEMPRWLTLVFAALVFSLVLFFYDEIRELRARRLRRKSDGAGAAVKPSREFDQERFPGFPPRAVWTLLLLITPFVLKITNGLQGLEHVPATAGIIYALCMLIAVVSDNRLVFDRDFRWSNIHFRGWGLILLISGIMLIFLPFVGVLTERGFQFGVLGGITTATLICCVGLIALFLAMHFGLAAADGAKKIPWQPIRGALLIIFAVWPISTFMVWVSGKSLFELSVEFWSNFAIWTLVVSIVLTAACRWVAGRPGPMLLKSGFDFLLAPFPKSTMFVNLKRHARITFFIAVGFGYWNVVMAPGIYGNDTAVRFFNQMFCDYITEIEGSNKPCRAWIKDPISLPPSTNFVVTATSLEQKKERYFVFNPNTWRSAANELHTESAASDAELEELSKRDPRWSMAGPQVTWENTLKVLFASGSPFPVFPATRAGLAPESERHEWLVDGGYAHNVPVEAAHAVGARTVLVISSSILHQHMGTGQSAADYGRELVRSPTGNFWKNVPRLFPYLFERSQIEDAVSADEMIVATLSPIDRDDWPLLTDFKSAVVADLLQAAEEDKTERIALVESWGTPTCSLAGVEYHCEELNAIESIQSH